MSRRQLRFLRAYWLCLMIALRDNGTLGPGELTSGAYRQALAEQNRRWDQLHTDEWDDAVQEQIRQTQRLRSIT